MTSLTISPGPVTPETRRRPMTSLRALSALGWTCLAAILVVLAFIYRDAIQWLTFTPLVVAIAIVLGFLLYLRRIEGAIPYFEIGAFYVSVAAIYATYPLLKYVLQGYRYEVGDYRLVTVNYYPRELAALAWWHVAYLLSFAVVYALVRGRRALHGRLRVTPPDWSTIASVLLLLTASKLFFVVLGIFYDLRVGSYMESYLVIQRLPLFIRQIATQVQGIGLTLQIMLVVALTCGKRGVFRVLLYLFLLVATLSHLVVPGGRIELVAVIISAVAAHHLAVRRVQFRWLAMAGVAGFLLVVALGVVRTDQAFGQFQLSRLTQRMTEEYTEFEVIFGNAVEMKWWRYGEGQGIFLDKPNLYWSGLLAVIPQQFLPLEKDTPWVWFTRTYYPDYYADGGGMAFGVLAEAVAGYGWPEMVWRGALIGLLFGLLHRSLYRAKVSPYLFMFYIWLAVWSYLTIRAGTFAPLMLILYRFIVPVAGIWLLSVVMRRARRRITP
ncbi:MAG: hypothetical protein ACJ74H_07385 [Thermoanaerobaculia bacterium]